MNFILAGRQGRKSGIGCCLDPRVRRNDGRGEGGKDDGWGCVVGGGFFHGRGHLFHVMPFPVGHPGR